MAKRKKSRRSKRRNPLARRRRNPELSIQGIKNQFLGANFGNVKDAALMALGGGVAIAIGTAAFGSRLGGGALGKAAVAVIAGLVGGVLVSLVGDKVAPGNQLVQNAAVAGTMGAMVLGFWSAIQPVVEPWADSLNAKMGLAAWTKEFDGLGQNYYDEFGPDAGMGGFGQPVIAATNLMSPKDNPFLSGYEPLGDIYNSQRLGSFEAEPGLGGFVPEVANPRDQQVADEMKHAAGIYGGYEGTLFEPFIED